ncbi:hypothetical protein JW948_16450 [bacterium]|nr:hypothetical protein [bacterium]
MPVDLKQVFHGYVQNCHTFKLTAIHTYHSFTLRELNYFYDLGISLGYQPFTEDSIDGRARRMDISWWGKWSRNKGEWTELVLHLERENSCSKDKETLEKLFNQVRDYDPSYMIGILTCHDLNRVEYLNKFALRKMKGGEALLIYHIDQKIEDKTEVHAYLIKGGNISGPIVVIQKTNKDTDIIYMVLEKEIPIE